MKEKPQVGDIVRLNQHGLRRIWGHAGGLEPILKTNMTVTAVGEDSLTEPEQTWMVEVDDDISIHMIDNWCFDLVQRPNRFKPKAEKAIEAAPKTETVENWGAWA